MSHPRLKTTKEDDHPVVGEGALRPAWVRSCGVKAVAALDRPAPPSMSAPRPAINVGNTISPSFSEDGME